MREDITRLRQEVIEQLFKASQLNISLSIRVNSSLLLHDSNLLDWNLSPVGLRQWEN